MRVHRHHHSRCGKLSAFTLFELLLVMLIISLISAFVIPRMAATLPGVQLKSSARAVAAALRYARSRAVSESVPYIAHFDNTQRFLAVEAVEKPMDASEWNSIKLIMDRSKSQKVYDFPDGIEFSLSNGTDADQDRDALPIFFFPRGNSTGGRIVLQHSHHKQYTITVDRITGSVEIDRL